MIAIDLTVEGVSAPFAGVLFDPAGFSEAALRLIAARLASAHARRVAPATASIGMVGKASDRGGRRVTSMMKV